MRRPLKPFLTEYKSPARRVKDVFDSPQPPGSGSVESFNESPSPPSRNTPPEDSYEAALRAADALFAPASPAKRAVEPPASDTRPQPPAQSEAHEAFTPPEPAPLAPERPSGRILQAIEATAVDPFAAMEAERAPKRRGRKPGSKNKPKLPIAASDVAHNHLHEDLDDELLDDEVVTSDESDAEDEILDVPSAKPRRAPTVGYRPLTASLTAAAAPPGPRTVERFTWVRTTLRPGEKWKRRLPKVAW